MPKSFHPAVRRRLDTIGPSIRLWRRARGLSASEVADRAGISRPTLRQIEIDPTGVSFGNVFAVLSVLGVDAELARAVDPMESATGRTLIEAAVSRGGRS